MSNSFRLDVCFIALSVLYDDNLLQYLACVLIITKWKQPVSYNYCILLVIGVSALLLFYLCISLFNDALSVTKTI
jgi:hypothetical protein